MSLSDLLRDLAESLKPPEEKPRTHGCYYVVEGQPPERCVLEYGRPQDCVFATQLVAQGKDQTTCQYWRPLQQQPARSQFSRSESESRKSQPPVVKEPPKPETVEQASGADAVQAIIARIQERDALIQAVITREILDKPLALRRRGFRG